jgi:putative multiple sugar transport system ATP-binding protein
MEGTAVNVMIEMQEITKTFPGVIALDHVSLKVEAGTVHAICGENGAGKSTLMGVLSGVYPHGSYTGEIFFQGQPVAFRNIHASGRMGIVIIHQELALVPELSIAENLFLGHENARWGIINWERARIRARELMRSVGLHEHPDTAIKHLGVGKQQLVEIAKALGKYVKLLILDEPTAALNEADSEHLLGILRGLRHKGVTCIIISHKLNEIREIADTITILRDGQSVETLRMDQGVDEDRIIRGMVGRPLGARYPASTPCTGAVFFEVRNWTVRHPQILERLLCKQINFHVRCGEVVGFAGLMGAGRTELARSIFGRSYGIYESGQIFKDGRELHLRTVADAIRAGIAYVPEERKTQGLNLLDSVKATIVSANLRGIAHSCVLDHNSEFAVADKYHRSLHIKTRDVSACVATLSGGNQQKVVLGKWLFTEPDLLILDEPTRGIDVGAKYEIYGLIRELAEAGRAIVVISSELPEVLGLSDRIYAICEGVVTGVLDRAEASPERLMKLMTATAIQQSEKMENTRT